MRRIGDLGLATDQDAQDGGRKEVAGASDSMDLPVGFVGGPGSGRLFKPDQRHRRRIDRLALALERSRRAGAGGPTRFDD